MAGRIRTLKPEWLEDEKLARCSAEARLLSVAVILLCDDFGNGRAHPNFLASQVFCFSEEPPSMSAIIAELSGWFLELYEEDGQSYFHIINWDRHQRVQHPGKPRVPPPPSAAKRPRASRGEAQKVAYFARGATTGLIKIGQSIDPVQRVVELAKCGSEALELLAVGGNEKELHEELKTSRVHGEWFRPTPEVLTKIRESGGDPDSPMFVAGYDGNLRAASGRDFLANFPEAVSKIPEVLAPDLRSPTTTTTTIQTEDLEQRRAHTHASAREGEPACEVLAALQSHPTLGPVADAEFARTIRDRAASRAIATGRSASTAELVAAIAEAAADSPDGQTREVLRRRVRAYTDHAGGAKRRASTDRAERGIIQPPSTAWTPGSRNAELLAGTDEDPF